MSDIDPKEAMDAWIAAKHSLTISETELNAAKAGHQVASSLEREAWEKIVKLCGREPLPPAPTQPPPVVAPPYAVTTIALNPLVSTGRLIPQTQSYGFGTTPVYSGSGAYFDSRARP